MTKAEITNEITSWEYALTSLCRDVSPEFTTIYNDKLDEIHEWAKTNGLDMKKTENTNRAIEDLIDWYLLEHNNPEPDAYYYATVALSYFLMVCFAVANGVRGGFT